MNAPPFVLTCTFVAVTAAVGGALVWVFGCDPEIAQRLSELSDPRDAAARSQFTRSRHKARDTLFTSLAKLGSRLLPGSHGTRERLFERFMHAGIYSPAGPSIFSSVRFALGAVMPMVLIVLGRIGLFDEQGAVIAACCSALVGWVGTALWLRGRIIRREREFRRSLADFLDLMGACLQAGQSFEGALSRVIDELRTAHPALTRELLIVTREMTLGSTPARALRGFAERSGLDVIRQLATLVDQSQRFGTSMTDALRTYAEMMRMQRMHRAETLAHKAGVKIMLPTLLFIFPPVLVILAGPAVIDLHEKFLPEVADASID